jgi:hypothetical protein
MASWTAAIVALSVWSGQLVDGHVHRAPHSGVIAHAGAYHLELVLAEDGEQLWVLDESEQVVRPPAGARLSLTFEQLEPKPDRDAPAAKPLHLMPADDHFERLSARGRAPSTRTLVRAELLMGGKTLRALFVYTLLDYRHRLWDL